MLVSTQIDINLRYNSALQAFVAPNLLNRIIICGNDPAVLTARQISGEGHCP
jgi:hypothetical protein